MTPELGWFRVILLRVAIGAATVLCGLAAVTVSLISKRAAKRVVHLWGRSCLLLTGVPVNVEGRERLIDDERYVIMANHESSLDIPVLLTAIPSSVELCFLAKKSLFRLPFLGWGMRSAGYIAVDRADRSSAASTLAQAVAEVESGSSPLVFPEETWTTDGSLLPFSRGGFLIALKTGLPILPVGLEGPRMVLRPGDSAIRPRSVSVRIGLPIPTKNLGVSQRQKLTAQTRREIERLRGPLGHVRNSDQN